MANSTSNLFSIAIALYGAKNARDQGFPFPFVAGFLVNFSFPDTSPIFPLTSPGLRICWRGQLRLPWDTSLHGAASGRASHDIFRFMQSISRLRQRSWVQNDDTQLVRFIAHRCFQRLLHMDLVSERTPFGSPLLTECI